MLKLLRNRIFCLLAVASAVVFTNTIYAADDVSVTVNGRRFQCGTDAPAEQLKSVCKCVMRNLYNGCDNRLNNGICAALILYSVNLSSGAEREVSWIDSFPVNDTSSCRSALESHPSCR